MVNFPSKLDVTDITLIKALRADGRASTTQLARITGFARGTIQNRLKRLQQLGVIKGWGPELDERATDFPVIAFTSMAIRQGAHEAVIQTLKSIPEVLEVHVITGGVDLLARLALRSNDHLHEVIQGLLATPGIARAETQLVLHSPVRKTLADVIAET